MFCPNCGCNCEEANFCPECGTDLRAFDIATGELLNKEIKPLNEPYYCDINGEKVDLHQIIRIYGTGIRKIGAYAYLQSNYHLSKEQAAKLLDPIYDAHNGGKFLLRKVQNPILI